MAKYEFTTAAGLRISERCLEFNKDACLGCVPYGHVEKFLRDEQYGGEYAVLKFVEWLNVAARSSTSAAKVLGLVAVGMAGEMVRDREFIGKVESFHTAMLTRFGVDESDVVKEGE
jgi:hypothetical protein